MGYRDIHILIVAYVLLRGPALPEPLQNAPTTLLGSQKSHRSPGRAAADLSATDVANSDLSTTVAGWAGLHAGASQVSGFSCCAFSTSC